MEETIDPEEQKEPEDVQDIEKEEQDEAFIGNMGNYTYTDSAGMLWEILQYLRWEILVILR